MENEHEHDPEVIRQQMQTTRTDLTEKLEALEQAVVGTVQETTAAVTDTVRTVEGAVKGTVEAVKGTVEETVEEVREAFNISRQVEKHPWLMVGGAFATGYLTGTVLTSALGSARRPSSRVAWPPREASLPPASLTAVPPPHAEPSGPSFLGSLLETFRPELDKLKGMAIGALVGTIGETVLREVPPQYKPQVSDLVHSLSTKLGGTVT